MNTFRDRSIFALKWAFISRFAHQSLQVVFSIILARLLVPSDFGLVAMVRVFSAFAILLNDFGFSSAIIQKKEVTKKEIDSVFWFNLFIGTVLFCLFFFFLDDVIADFYKDPRLVLITRIIAFTFIFNALRAIPNALLTKKLRFKETGIITVISLLVSSLVAIVLALHGHGYMALVYMALIDAGVNVVLLMAVTGYFPSQRFGFQSLRPFMRFGLNLTGDRVVTYWMRNMDQLLIGKMLDQYLLGLYNRSYRIMLYPLTNFTNVIRQVMFPAFSEVQDNIVKIKFTYLRITQAITIVTFPFIVMIFVLTHEFVFVLFGEKWLDMVPILKLLILVAIPQVILSLNGSVFLTFGKPHIALRLNLVFSVVMLAGFFAGIRLYGITGLITAYLLANILFFYPLFHYAAREMKLTLPEQLNNLKWIGLINLVLGIVIFLLRSALMEYSELLRFSLIVSFSMLAYTATMYLLRDRFESVVELLQLFRIYKTNTNRDR